MDKHVAEVGRDVGFDVQVLVVVAARHDDVQLAVTGQEHHHGLVHIVQVEHVALAGEGNDHVDVGERAARPPVVRVRLAAVGEIHPR